MLYQLSYTRTQGHEKSAPEGVKPIGARGSLPEPGHLAARGVGFKVATGRRNGQHPDRIRQYQAAKRQCAGHAEAVSVSISPPKRTQTSNAPAKNMHENNG